MVMLILRSVNRDSTIKTGSVQTTSITSFLVSCRSNFLIGLFHGCCPTIIHWSVCEAEALSQPLAKVHFLPTVIPQHNFPLELIGKCCVMLYNLRVPESLACLSCILAPGLLIENLSHDSCTSKKQKGCIQANSVNTSNLTILG